jgi:hypothetical protein
LPADAAFPELDRPPRSAKRRTSSVVRLSLPSALAENVRRFVRVGGEVLRSDAADPARYRGIVDP